MKVSVIVPTYNYGRFIEGCLNSIFSQTFKDFEVIVVDDGSTDGTGEIIKSYPRPVRSIYQENRGLPAARNRAIEASQGEYLAFLDSDDLWLPEKLGEQVRIMDGDRELGIVFSDASAFDGEKIIRESILEEESICTGHCFARLFMGNFLVMPTVMIRKSCLRQTGLFDETLPVVADYDLWLRISAFFRIGFVDRPLAMYRVHPSNMSKDFCRLLEDEIRVVQKVIELYPEKVKKLGKKVNMRLSSLYDQYGLEWVEKGEIGRATRCFLRAILEWPLSMRSFYYFMATLTGKRGFETLREFKRSWLRLNRQVNRD